jgi:hypothetical protein
MNCFLPEINTIYIVNCIATISCGCVVHFSDINTDEYCMSPVFFNMNLFYVFIEPFQGSACFRHLKFNTPNPETRYSKLVSHHRASQPILLPCSINNTNRITEIIIFFIRIGSLAKAI